MPLPRPSISLPPLVFSAVRRIKILASWHHTLSVSTRMSVCKTSGTISAVTASRRGREASPMILTSASLKQSNAPVGPQALSITRDTRTKHGLWPLEANARFRLTIHLLSPESSSPALPTWALSTRRRLTRLLRSKRVVRQTFGFTTLPNLALSLSVSHSLELRAWWLPLLPWLPQQSLYSPSEDRRIWTKVMLACIILF